MIEEILRLLRLLTGNPGNNIELGALALLSILACVLVVDKTTRLLKFPLTGTNRVAGLVVAAILLSLCAVAAANQFILPRIKAEALQPLVPILTGLVIFLAVVVPAACFVFKSPYFKTLFVMILGIAAAAALSFLLRGGIRAVRSGGKDFEKTRSRTEKVNQIL